jgi:pimeloyl-ACP methyl ester carboxylesterase
MSSNTSREASPLLPALPVSADEHDAVPVAYRRTIISAQCPPLHIGPESTVPQFPVNCVVVPVVMLHCLLGDSTQFKLLERSLEQSLQAHQLKHSTPLVLDCWQLDLRNHGGSPHTEEHTYQLLVADVRAFIRSHNLKRTIICGHSM